MLPESLLFLAWEAPSGGSVAETTTIKYRAFLSYSHRDTSWGKWLHEGLEGYRIDKDLVGRVTPVLGRCPKPFGRSSAIVRIFPPGIR